MAFLFKRRTDHGCQKFTCQNVSYEIRHNAPLQKRRMEGDKLQDLAELYDNAKSKPRSSTADMPVLIETNMKEFCIHTRNKLTAEITHKFDKDAISRLVRKYTHTLVPLDVFISFALPENGIFNFGIDLFYGSVKQNLDVVSRLREAVDVQTQQSGFSVPLSIYLRISPRTPFTGSLVDSQDSLLLESHSKVVLTADREYASRCCQNLIYVNARFLLLEVEKCDIIRVGNFIQLQVTETDGDKVTCTVVVPGEVVGRLPVEFPQKYEKTLQRISAEELEDLTFAIGTGIDIIVMDRPGTPEICSQIRHALDELKFCGGYLLTRLTLEDLEGQFSNAVWLIDGFDGFILDCAESYHKIVKLPTTVHKFVQQIHVRRKPLVLRGCWSRFVDPSDYKVAFFYPDKYVLPFEHDFLHLYEALQHRFNLDDIPMAGVSTPARSVASAAHELDAGAIITCDGYGRVAQMIAHYRPAAPIVAVTSVPDAVNFGGMHNNVWMLLLNKAEEISYTEDVLRKLVHGIQYALMKQIVCVESRVILVFRKAPDNGCPDRFVIMKFTENYFEAIKKVISDN